MLLLYEREWVCVVVFKECCRCCYCVTVSLCRLLVAVDWVVVVRKAGGFGVVVLVLFRFCFGGLSRSKVVWKNVFLVLS